ncbi:MULTISPECIES: helix-turn-helix domain-containing protein [Bacillus]|uniref:Phage element (ICEBs1)transcriptional regulator (Xre family) protein n=1 Tax=Bacillus atrophaeus (strain 1942) TaxID=720555 RepID=A0ABM5M4T1_BACA1|nr:MULTISPECIES: helix-turn-helix domain-containing protein [Bacillus]AMR64023.1 transcriptional regulator [Bacillus subtilis subsp. globigii]MCY8326872.1 helix-turn-helix domain-containing protein [Bacillus spizizenii]OTQ87456.1 XRE family transcriptional regulator [Bacillus subtilis subsp. subtilis]ADP35143.1 phage element (ICEBs1)transcriptional regulator (Xre family) protein [Bacillus atrophaeus 1942]AIK47479.1 HTH-type transcriptional regulator immR [Bacillus atrophaeus subsp. globigii]
MSFGHKLKTLRKQRGLTQKELAEKLFLSQSSITRFEKDEILPTSETLSKIANYFDVSIDFLLDRPQPPQKKNSNLEKAFNEAIEELKDEETLLFMKNGDIDEETAELIKKALKNGVRFVNEMKRKDK